MFIWKVWKVWKVCIKSSELIEVVISEVSKVFVFPWVISMTLVRIELTLGIEHVDDDDECKCRSGIEREIYLAWK